MALRFASWEENGKIVHGLVEKPCDSSCPCEKAPDKGIDNPAALLLSDLSPDCALQHIPRLVERSLLPQIRNRIEALSTADFEVYCKEQQRFHLAKVDEHIRFLANPGKRFCRKVLTNKLWNQQAIKVYSQALAANAINGTAIISTNATTHEHKVKSLSDALKNEFTVKQLKMLISSLVPNWELLRELPKEQQQGRGKNGEWKSAFPAVVAVLEASGYIINSLSDKRLSFLFEKELGVSISDKTFAKRRIQDEVFRNNNYSEKATSWLREEFAQ